MVITRITKHKSKRGKFAVYVDGEYSFDVSNAVLLQYALRTGESVDEGKLQTIKASEVRREAEQSAVNFISYRPRSSKELLDHLVRKGHNKELAAALVRHFESVSLINNLEFARMFVRDKLRRKPTGKALLQRHLVAKGISSVMIDQVLGENVSDEEQRIAAQDLASRRLRLTKRSMTKLDPLKQKQRLTGYLLRHGFSNEIVHKTIQSLFRQ